jgi:hypothetical protein
MLYGRRDGILRIKEMQSVVILWVWALKSHVLSVNFN